MQRLIIMTLLLSFVASAADVTGKWTAHWEFSRADGTKRSGSTPLVLKQEGEKLSGHTYSTKGDPLSLREAKIDGDRVTFEVPDLYIPVKFELRLRDGKLAGKAMRMREERIEVMTVNCERVAEK